VSADKDKAVCTLELRIKNPNKVGCTLKDLNSKVIINSVYVGDINLRNSVKVGAGKVVNIPIKVVAPYTSLQPLLKTGVDMLLHKDKKVPVVVDASITLKKALIKKKMQLKIQQDYALKDML
jgi:LEA14-like dessication related protein